MLTKKDPVRKGRSPVPLYRTEGICLRSYELKEADRIVVLLTRDEGKVRAVAKGVRRLGSRLAGGLLSFTHSRFLLYRGRELDKVIQCEAVAGFRPLREDLAGHQAQGRSRARRGGLHYLFGSARRRLL